MGILTLSLPRPPMLHSQDLIQPLGTQAALIAGNRDDRRHMTRHSACRPLQKPHFWGNTTSVGSGHEEAISICLAIVSSKSNQYSFHHLWVGCFCNHSCHSPHRATQRIYYKGQRTTVVIAITSSTEKSECTMLLNCCPPEVMLLIPILFSKR